jgi:hypothetical protein
VKSRREKESHGNKAGTANLAKKVAFLTKKVNFLSGPTIHRSQVLVENQASARYGAPCFEVR